MYERGGVGSSRVASAKTAPNLLPVSPKSVACVQLVWPMPLSVAAPAPSEPERAGSHGGAPSTSGTVSRASARAQRRIQASAARRRTTSEVLLLTSKAFPSDQYQELLTFLKGLHLPPDATSLFTTVRNEQFANKKALLSAHTKEVDEVLGRYGGDWALLSLCAEELGLGTTAASPPGRKSTAQGKSPTQQGALVQRNGSVLTAGQFSGADESTALHALSQKWAERQPRTDGVARRPGGGFTLSVEALGVRSPALCPGATGPSAVAAAQRLR